MSRSEPFRLNILSIANITTKSNTIGEKREC